MESFDDAYIILGGWGFDQIMVLGMEGNKDYGKY